MKYLTAIVKPRKLDGVMAMPQEAAAEGPPVSGGGGFDRQRGHGQVGHVPGYKVALFAKVKVKLSVETERVDAAIEAILRTPQMGGIGDGNIFLSSLEQTTGIQTGDRHDGAL